MKILKRVQGGAIVLLASGATMFLSNSALAALPEELTDLYTAAGADALLAVGAAIAAYAVYRGALAAFTVGKRMLSKAGF